MACNPTNVQELPGSNNSTENLIVRGCLSVKGQDVMTQVFHDATLTGLGNSPGSPLSVVGVASTDHIDLVDGAAVPVAPVGVLRIRQVGGVLQVSYSTGAYVDVVTL